MLSLSTSSPFPHFYPCGGVSTSSGSESPFEDSYDYQDQFHFSLRDLEPASYEIDVKPKKKVFGTREEKRRYVQEYKKKVKTELCKNWEMKGTCKYGEKCCFAHGRQELKEKVHLHSNYKTKPCKQYFFHGTCPYGYRCQYMHNEIKQNMEKTQEFIDFLNRAYEEMAIPVNFLSKKALGSCLQLKKIENLLSIDEKKEGLPIAMRRRLPIFNKVCFSTNPSQQTELAGLRRF